jgi:integrase/recombinase XerD
MTIISIDLQEYRGSDVWVLTFPYDQTVIDAIKKLSGARWNASGRAWHLPVEEHTLSALKENLTAYAELNDSVAAEKVIKREEISTSELAYGEKLKEFGNWLMSKRYSANTQKIYLKAVKIFLRFMKGKLLVEINLSDVIRFNNEYIIARKYSASYQNQVVNGIKLFFSTVEGKIIVLEDIHRPRSERKLPSILSKEEVKKILESPVNLKHKTMLSLIYACGLRRGELLSIKPADILSDRKLLHIKQSKGKKDRVVPLSDKLLDMLRQYYKAYRPLVWLFEGQKEGDPYSEKSISNVLKQAVDKSGIKKPVTLHWLRHSYATHLLESGTDLRYIQQLLGHNSSRTTELYTHVSNKSIQQIRSPFDDL